MSGKKRLEKTVWVPVEGLDFEMLVRFLPRKELQRMLERATESTWSRQAGQNVDRINNAKLLREYAAVIVDWRQIGAADTGLRRETFARMVNIDPEEYPSTIPCTEDYKVELLEEAYGLDAVVRQVCTDLARFQEEREELERKNS
jgi:hypothetical protein